MEPNTDLIPIGERLRKIRKEHNEGQKELAEAINVSKDSISKYERGVMRMTFDNMILISNHYKVSLDYLIKGEGGSDLLDTLNTYIKLNYKEITDTTSNNTPRSTPVLSINRSYFEYLVQIANANSNENIPEELREQWKQIETDKFKRHIGKDNYDDMISIIPIDNKTIGENPDLHIAISNSRLKEFLATEQK